MNLHNFKLFCCKYVAPKKVVEDYFKNDDNLKDNYTSVDTDLVYKFYMQVLADAPKEAHKNPRCFAIAGGGKKTTQGW